MLSRLLPGLSLFRGYKRAWLAGDLAAGVTGCVVVVPSVIAYARLMGMPPQIGLFAALAPLLVYPFLTSSPQVIVGTGYCDLPADRQCGGAFGGE